MAAPPTPCQHHSPASPADTLRASRDGSGAAPGHDPRNFLMSGGTRALECERARQQAAQARQQVKGMRSTNASLSAQLARARQEGEREVTTLRSELLALTGRFRAEQVRGVGCPYCLPLPLHTNGRADKLARCASSASGSASPGSPSRHAADGGCATRAAAACRSGWRACGSGWPRSAGGGRSWRRRTRSACATCTSACKRSTC